MYNMQHRIAHVYSLEAISNLPNATGPPPSDKKESINLRRLDFRHYIKNPEEKESYKVLHQLEFNSLREHSLHKSAKEERPGGLHPHHYNGGMGNPFGNY